MNYPRRRAPIACNFCRQRKRKCDGHKPACRLCHAAGVTCDYQDGSSAPGPAPRPQDKESTPATDLNQTAGEIIRRIEGLEKLVRQQAENPPLAAAPVEPPAEETEQQQQQAAAGVTFPTNMDQDDPAAAMPAFFETLWMPSELPLFPPAPQIPHASPPGDEGYNEVGSLSSREHATEEPLTIPIGHLTPTSSLFALEPIKRLIGEYPENFFYQIESARQFEPPAAPTAPFILDKDETDCLLAAFFTEIHPHFPILDPDSFVGMFNQVMFNHTGDDVDRALCLVILAFGKLASNRQASSPGQWTGDDGLEYFGAAYHTLTTRWVTSFDPGLSLPCGLVYLAIYLCYIERPLQAWRLIHMASTKLQAMLSQIQPESITQEDIDCIGRLCWTCFLLECDTLAEFHLPRSGIEVVIDRMPFPCFTDRIYQDGLPFLAICSIRRLLNRIHRGIYATQSRPRENSWIGFALSPAPNTIISTMSSLECVCTELARQLAAWLDSLPDSIKPDLSQTVPSHRHDGWLRLRYWSAKHIICRPCLIYAATLPDHATLPPYVMKYSEICVDSCRNYINTATHVLAERTQYTWMTIQASLACAFVIVIASQSPHLTHFVPDANILLSRVITSTQRWATPGSSAESIVLILNTIHQKQRLSKGLHRGSFSASSMKSTISQS